MKKILSFLLLAMTLFMATPANAEVKFGVRGGLNLTNMKFSSDILSKSNRAGFYVGPTVLVKVPIVGLAFDLSAVYDLRCAAVEVADGQTESMNSNAIAIPVNIRYGVSLGKVINVFAFAGPQFSFNIGKDKTVAENFYDWSWKKSNVSINVGVGAVIKKHYELKANYNIACGKYGESASDIAGNVISGKHNAWQIGLGYYF
ncbi:MAG: porin family protein [Prevotella sp.]|nr:porin family protein [Candidatus Prevotella equi]